MKSELYYYEVLIICAYSGESFLVYYFLKFWIIAAVERPGEPLCGLVGLVSPLEDRLANCLLTSIVFVVLSFRLILVFITFISRSNYSFCERSLSSRARFFFSRKVLWYAGILV